MLPGIYILIAFALLFAGYYIWWRISGLKRVFAHGRVVMLHEFYQGFNFSISAIKRHKLISMLDYATDNGFRFCSLDELLNNPDDPKLIAVTFDDGYADILDNLDIFKSRKITVTIFILADCIGRQAFWDYKPQASKHLDKEDIQKLSDSGLVTFGSHGMNHRDLTRLSHEKLIYELKHSRIKLEEITGQEIKYISYPFGRYNDTVIEQARQAGYSAAFCGVPAFVREDYNYAYPRIPLNLLDNLYTFRQKLGPGNLAWLEYSKARTIELFSGLTDLIRGKS